MVVASRNIFTNVFCLTVFFVLILIAEISSANTQHEYVPEPPHEEGWLDISKPLKWISTPQKQVQFAETCDANRYQLSISEKELSGDSAVVEPESIDRLMPLASLPWLSGIVESYFPQLTIPFLISGDFDLIYKEKLLVKNERELPYQPLLVLKDEESEDKLIYLNRDGHLNIMPVKPQIISGVDSVACENIRRGWIESDEDFLIGGFFENSWLNVHDQESDRYLYYLMIFFGCYGNVIRYVNSEGQTVYAYVDEYGYVNTITEEELTLWIRYLRQVELEKIVFGDGLPAGGGEPPEVWRSTHYSVPYTLLRQISRLCQESGEKERKQKIIKQLDKVPDKVRTAPERKRKRERKNEEKAIEKKQCIDHTTMKQCTSPLKEVNRDQVSSAESRMIESQIAGQMVESVPISPFLNAVANDNAELVKEYLEGGVDVNKMYSNGLNALMIAAWNGAVSVVELLIQNGVDVNACNDFNASALSYAAAIKETKILKLLLEAGATVDVANSGNGYTPLMVAVEENNKEAVELLLKSGANVFKKSHSPYTPLSLALKYGYINIARLLNPRTTNSVAEAIEHPVSEEDTESLECSEMDIHELFFDESMEADATPDIASKAPVTEAKGLTIYDIYDVIHTEHIDSDKAWSKGVDTSQPPFVDYPGFLQYLEGKLNRQEKIIYQNIKVVKASRNKILAEVCGGIRKRDMSYVKVYVASIFARSENVNFSSIVQKLDSLLVRLGDSSVERFHVYELIKLFFSLKPKELFSLGTLFPRGGYISKLKRLASQETDEGRNATYWLIRLLHFNGNPEQQIVATLNVDRVYWDCNAEASADRRCQAPATECPFGDKWAHFHINYVLGNLDIDKCLNMISADNVVKQSKRAVSQKLFFLMNDGDIDLIKRFVIFFASRERCKDVAGRLKDRVIIPGFPKEKNWRAHMIRQIQNNDKVTLQPPKDDKQWIALSKKVTRAANLAEKLIQSERKGKPSTEDP